MNNLTGACREQIAAEASRYLDVLQTFEALAAIPHAHARMHAAHAREQEDDARRREAEDRPSVEVIVDVLACLGRWS